MADVNTEGGGGGKHHQKKRAKKLPTRIDMTPLVDLGFLLLTFFMLTTTFSKPKVIELTPPVKSNDSTQIKDTLALTIVLSGNNKIYYYNGELIQNQDSNNIKLTDFSDNGIRKVILQRNSFVAQRLAPLDAQHENKQISDTAYEKAKQKIQADKLALFVIIKTDSLAKYLNVVALLDDMTISNVDKYALIDVSKPEVLMITDYNNKHNIK
jgi:biopolymer transport protein ExbD